MIWPTQGRKWKIFVLAFVQKFKSDKYLLAMGIIGLLWGGFLGLQNSKDFDLNLPKFCQKPNEEFIKTAENSGYKIVIDKKEKRIGFVADDNYCRKLADGYDWATGTWISDQKIPQKGDVVYDWSKTDRFFWGPKYVTHPFVLVLIYVIGTLGGSVIGLIAAPIAASIALLMFRYSIDSIRAKCNSTQRMLFAVFVPIILVPLSVLLAENLRTSEWIVWVAFPVIILVFELRLYSSEK